MVKEMPNFTGVMAMPRFVCGCVSLNARISFCRLLNRRVSISLFQMMEAILCNHRIQAAARVAGQVETTSMAQSQTWNPQTYAHNARFVSDLAGPVVELLAPRRGERILDLGCGDGVLTAKLAAMGCRMVGVDASAPQIAAARGLGLDARVADGERLNFDAEFDAVFSNAALHWMRRPDAVIAGVWRALAPGGRFAGEMGGHGCVAKIRAALIAAVARRGLDGEAVNPWYFPR